jgi:hypothetical protein
MSTQAELAPPAIRTLSASEGSPPSEQPAPDSPTPDPLATLQSELESSRQTLETLKRERQITRALFEAGALDLDITTVLIERELATHPKADPVALVGELLKRKPNLFRRSPTPPTDPVKVKPPTGPIRAGIAALSAMAARTTPADPFEQAAQSAAESGNRASLLAYMRLKRQPAD